MNNYVYILVAFAVIYAVRVLPLTLIRRQIKSRFLRSFLYYVPYVTLAVMTFPAMMDVTHSWIAGLVSLVVSCIAAYFGVGLALVALIASGTVFVLQLFL